MTDAIKLLGSLMNKIWNELWDWREKERSYEKGLDDWQRRAIESEDYNKTWKVDLVLWSLSM